MAVKLTIKKLRVDSTNEMVEMQWKNMQLISYFMHINVVILI